MPEYNIKIDSTCMQLMHEHAKRTFPEECCGFMLGSDAQGPQGTRSVVAIIAIDNTKDDNRKRRYLISPMEQLRAERQAREASVDVIGIYHSHPNHPSQASDFDREHAMPFWSYVIVSCIEGEIGQVQSWRLRDDRSIFDEETIQ